MDLNLVIILHGLVIELGVLVFDDGLAGGVGGGVPVLLPCYALGKTNVSL